MYVLPTQGKLVHTLEHTAVADRHAPSKPCVVYSLSHQSTVPCLLSAGSLGPARVWKAAGWDEEEDEQEEMESKPAGG